MEALTLPGRIKDYSGPRNHSQICKKVSEDALANGMEVPDSMVNYIIGRFFFRMKSHMRLGDTIIIDDLGKMGISSEEKKKRLAEYQKDYYEQREIHAKINRRREFNKNVKKKFKRFNEKRVSLGQKEWTMVEWSKVFKIYKMPRYYRQGRWDKSRKKALKVKLKKQ